MTSDWKHGMKTLENIPKPTVRTPIGERTRAVLANSTATTESRALPGVEEQRSWVWDDPSDQLNRADSRSQHGNRSWRHLATNS
jgi:hypothetical protein